MSTHPDLAAENQELRARLAEAQETIEAIRSGAVDALVTSGPAGEQVFTLHGAETPYRLLMESMNEGAATLTPDGTVLYSNHRFAEMAGLPAEQIVGSGLGECVLPKQRSALRELIAHAGFAGRKAEFTFSRAGGPGLPVLLSLAPIAMVSGSIGVVATDLSERKAHEQRLNQLNQELEERVRQRTAELRESEERLKRSQEIAHLGSWELDLARNRLSWSDEVYRLFGLTPQEFGATYEAFLERVHPEDRQKVDDAYSGSLRANRDAYEVEHRIVRKDTGAVRVIHERCEHFRDAAGKIIRSVGMVQDITGLKQAETALRNKEAELRAITEVTPVMLTRCSRDLRYLYANRAYASMLGITPEQIIGKPIMEIMGETGFATIRPRVEQVLAGQPAEYEDQVHFVLTGKSRWLHAAYMPERDAHGQVVGWIASIADITERKQAEEALRRIEAERKIAEAVQLERQRFQDVLNMLPAYIVLLSPDYHVPFANRFFEERFGKANERQCHEYLFKHQEPGETCESFKVLQTHAPHRWERTGPDGRNYDISDFPFTDVDGSPLVMEVGLDVTERKKAEAELTRHREHLQELVHERTARIHEANEELSRFNRAMVGRELRMIELKEEINALCAGLGRPPAYPLAEEQLQPKPPTTG